MINRYGNRMMAGTVLVVLGLGLFAMQFVRGIGDAVFFFILAALFLAGYAHRRASGLLIAGCLLAGLGLGSLDIAAVGGSATMQTLGLGAGFAAVYVVRLLVERQSVFWPILPASVLITVGLAESHAAVKIVLRRGWPLILVVFGLLVMTGVFSRSANKSG